MSPQSDVLKSDLVWEVYKAEEYQGSDGQV